MYKLASRLWRQLVPPPLRRGIDRYILFSNLPSRQRHRHYPAGPPTIAGFLQSGFGIAQAARLEVEALRQGGVPFDLIDLSDAYGNRDLQDPLFVSTPCPSPYGPLLLHVNAPEVGRALRVIGKSLTSNRPIVGLWAWELPQPPPHWHLAYRCLDELWVPSHYVADAFRPDCPIPVKVVPHPVNKPQGRGLERAYFGLPETACIFLAMADGRSDLERKNLLGTVHAFRKGFGNREDVLLLLKLHHTDFATKQLKLLAEAIAGAMNIRIVNELMDRPTITDLTIQTDVFISLHRAEGFGLTLAEAMLLGKPVVATAFSGNMDFMPAKAETLIDYTLVQVASDNPNYAHCGGMQWAAPDIDQAADRLRRLADEPGFRRATAKLFTEQAEIFFQPLHFCREVAALQQRHTT